LRTRRETSAIVQCTLFCAPLLLLAAQSSQSLKTLLSPALDNEFVQVRSIPPATRRVDAIENCILKSGNAMVELEIPVQERPAKPDAASEKASAHVAAIFVQPRGLYGCSAEQGVRRVLVELKARPPASPFADDAVKLDPAHNEVLLDNDRVRVVRIHFAPGESGPMVDKRPRVIVVLTDSHASVTLPDGHSEIRDAKAGTIYFGRAGRQTTNNLGATPLENIVVELKSK